MPELGWTAQPQQDNPLFHLGDFHKNALIQQGAEQDLTDRATLRAQAPGLATGNAQAMGIAASLPSVGGTHSVQAMTQAETAQDTRHKRAVAFGAQAAGALLAAPPDQRAALYQQLLPQMKAAGMDNAPPVYPGDYAAKALQNMGLTAEQQTTLQNQRGTTDPTRDPMGLAPGIVVGPGGAGASGGSGAAPPANKQAFIDTWRPEAERIAARVGTSPDNILAHWGVETGWGASLHGNNVGNITTGSSWQGPAENRGDTDAAGKPIQQNFRVYKSPQEAADDYATLLQNQRYAGARGTGDDALKFATGLQAGGYMTSPTAPQNIAAARRTLGGGQPAPAPQPAPGSPVPGALTVSSPSMPGGASEAPSAAPVAAPAAAATPIAAPALPNQNPLMAVADPASAGQVPQNALTPIAAPGAPPAPGQRGAPSAAPGTVIQAGAPIQTPTGAVVFQGGKPVPGGKPGYVQTIGPNGMPGMARMPGAPRELEFKAAGDQMITFDKNTGEEVSRTQIPETGRLTQIKANGQIYLVTSSGKQVMSIQEGTRDVQAKDYERDGKDLDEIAAHGANAQAAQVRLLKMRELASQLPTGSNLQTRTTWANFARTYMPGKAGEDLASKLMGGSSPDVAQEFAKLALTSAGQQEQQVLGGRGGYQAIKLYQSANPSLELDPKANQQIINMQLVAAQADADYARGAMEWVHANGDAFRQGGTYIPRTHFDEVWQKQKNPQVYSAAIGAMNGEPFEKWTKGLQPDEAIRAGQILARLDPTMQVMGRGKNPDGTPVMVPVSRLAQQQPKQQPAGQ